jgi:hypothetical protein
MLPSAIDQGADIKGLLPAVDAIPLAAAKALAWIDGPGGCAADRVPSAAASTTEATSTAL